MAVDSDHSRIERLLALMVVCVGVMGWSVALTFGQPLTEPSPERDTYWARDVRLALIVLVAAAFVWAGRGRRLVGWFAVAGVAGWVTLDVVLDRDNVVGPFACALLAVGCSTVLGGLCWLAGRGTPARSSRGLLVAAGAIAATVAGSGPWTEVAAEVPEPWSTLCPLVIGGLGILTTLGCASAIPGGPVRRPLGLCGLVAALALGLAVTVMPSALMSPVIMVSMLTAVAMPVRVPVGLCVLVAAGAVGLAMTVKSDFLMIPVIVVALVTGAVGVWDIASEEPPRLAVAILGQVPRRVGPYRGTVLAVMLGWFALAAVLEWVWADYLARYNEWVLGDWLTALAGNPPAYDPQAYSPSIFMALAIGLVLGLLIPCAPSAGGQAARADVEEANAPAA
ncbi:hypothetical protein [Pseudonocardia acaciae]|uniref:hypothetical protein n=1 Tax=Pseudonocardia acaciae TaxID=551276 RepID=UPI00048E4920|nr:hypothetical protein [Pseudonocardia acaciae]